MEQGEERPQGRQRQRQRHLRKLQHVACCRKFLREEVAFIIRNGEELFGLKPWAPPAEDREEICCASSSSPPPPPPPYSGQVILCPKEHVKVLKQRDGLPWIKRPNSGKVREDHIKFKLADGSAMVYLYYSKLLLEARGQGPPSLFFRRRYILVGSSSLQLLHYLDEEEAKRQTMTSPLHPAMLVMPLMDPVWDDQACCDLLPMECAPQKIHALEVATGEEAGEETETPSNSVATTAVGDWSDFLDVNDPALLEPLAEVELGDLFPDGSTLLSEEEGEEDLTSRDKPFGGEEKERGRGEPEGLPKQLELHPSFFLANILDMSPSWDFVGGGGKVIICLSCPLPRECHANGDIVVVFGDRPVPADIIAPQVLRCFAPSSPIIGLSAAGQVHVRLQLGTPSADNDLQISPISGPFDFEYRPMPQLPSPQLGMEAPTRFSRSVNVKKRPRSSEKDVEVERAPRPESWGPESPWTFRSTRSVKIRVVERLGEVAQAGAHSQSASSQCSPNPSACDSLSPIRDWGGSFGGSAVAGGAHMPPPAPAEVKWGTFNSNTEISQEDLLDDVALSELEDEKLEDLLNRLVVRVMDQLAQLASTDAGLEGELDAMDPAGFSLLHYACIYDLEQLVPKLLESGAVDPNQRTGDGYSHTPLHLAASVGSIKVAMHLLRSGASLEAIDSEGLTPADAAHQMGFGTLGDWLHEVAQYPPEQRRESVASIDLSCKDLMGRKNGHDPQGRGSVCDSTTSQLLQTTFSSLSLHEKCAVSLSLTPRGSRCAAGASEAQADVSSSSILSEDERGLLQCAMSMMGPEELGELEKQARIIQQNMRAWALRKNYKTLRTAARTLQLAWRSRPKGRPPIALLSGIASTAQPGHSGNMDKEITASTALQAAARGLLARRQFGQMKLEATALLMLRRNPKLQNWIAQQRHNNGACV